MTEPKTQKSPKEDGIPQSQYDSEEFKFLNELEVKIQEFPPMTEIISFITNPTLDVSEDNATQNFKQQEPTLFSWIEENISKILPLAAKYEKHITVQFLLQCEVNVNATDDTGKSAANYAWTYKNYKILLSLLKADSFFPAGFDSDELNLDDSDAKEIINLVHSRFLLHELIEKGDVEDVKNFKMNEASKLYLNINNESAAYVALKHEQFSTYAYLKSIGAEFGKNEEKLALDKLEFKEKVALQEAMVRYFPPVSDAHIHYLISKSRSQKRDLNLAGKLKNYYGKLDKIPEISIILKVIQYADYLDVVFDFDEAEVSKVYPLVSSKDCSRGETVYKIGRIYIAASLKKRARQEILGTIAHELTHMVMQILYENDCNPYGKCDDNIVDFFKDFKDGIRSVTGDPSKILLDAIDKYAESDHDSELIVRVPQILAQFSSGRNWLEELIPQFFTFYKETIVPKCKKFLDEGAILKPKSMIKSINESVGELLRLKKCNITFKNTQNLVLNDDKKIFVYKVENTLLGTLKVLQRLYGKGYVNFHSHFLVLKFKTFISQLDEMSQAFFMEGSQWLIIEISHNPSEDEMYKVCDKISELLEIKPNKSVIFVANRNVVKFLNGILEATDLEKLSHQIVDDDLNFDHLDQNSQNQILKKKVTFQGQDIMFKKLIQSPELYRFINPGIIESIIEGRKVNIGNKIFGLSSLDGPYSDIIQETDFQSFVGHLKNSNDIFIIRSKQNEEVVKYFSSKFEEKWVSTKYFKNVKCNFEKEKERILLVNDRFKAEDFKNFCRFHSSKKCHLIDVQDLKTNSFVLQQIYNPDFYVKRKVKKIFLKYDTMDRFITANRSVTFIVNRLNVEDCSLLKYENVKLLAEKEEEKTFRALKESGETVHWFRMEDDVFVWKNSHGYSTNLRYCFRKDRAEDEENYLKNNNNSRLFEEENFISEITDRKILLIADNPGTGKSTALTKLYGAKQIANTHWIIRINIKDHLNAIRENISSKLLNVRAVIQFLQEIELNLKDELNDNLLQVALTTENQFPKCLLIVLDGFDEVLDEDDRGNIIHLIQFLKDETYCKVWITSRLQYKDYLEEELNTFAFQFDPFDDEMKTFFIEKYLKDHLSLIVKEELFAKIFRNKENSKISVFTKQLLLKMNEIFKNDVREFIGAPLQLNLIMSGSVEYFKNWAQKEEELHLQHLGNNLVEVYENFIQRKYKIYFKKCDIIEKTRQEKEEYDSEKYNKELAESLVYQQKVLKPAHTNKKIIFLIGLVVSQNGENFEFIHFTFREYYFAKMFAEYLLEEEIPSLFYEKMVFLFRKIFVKPKFQMIRNFFNVILKEKITERKLEDFKKFFLQNDEAILKSYTTSDSVLPVLSNEGHENILNTIFSIYFFIKTSSPFSFKMTNILNRTLFLSSALSGKCNIWKTLFQLLKKSLKFVEKYEYYYYWCVIGESVHVVVRMKNWKLMKTLLQGLEETFSKDETRSFLITIDKQYNIFKDIFEEGDSFEILDLLSKMEEQLWYFVVTNDGISLHAAARMKDSRFMESLWQKYEDIVKGGIPEAGCMLLTIKDSSGKTILHTAAEKGISETCKLILDKVKLLLHPEGQENFLKIKDAKGLTALDLAVREHQRKTVQLLIEEGEKICNTTESFHEFLTTGNMFSAFSDSILKDSGFKTLMTLENIYAFLFYSACSAGDSTVVNFILEKLKNVENPEKLAQFLMGKSVDGNTCLHFAVKNKTIEFLTFIFQEFIKYLSPKDVSKLIMAQNKKGETVLHKAAKLSSANVVQFLFEKTTEMLGTREQLELYSMINKNSKTFFYFVLTNYSLKVINFVWEKYEKLFDLKRYFIALTGKNILHATNYDEGVAVQEFILKKMETFLGLEDQWEMLMVTDKNNRYCVHFAVDPLLFLEKIFSSDHRQFFLENIIGTDILFLLLLRNNLDALKRLLQIANEMLAVEQRRELLMLKDRENQKEFFKEIYQPAVKLEAVKLLLEKVKEMLPYEEFQILLPTDCYDERVLVFSSFDYTLNSKSVSLILEKVKSVYELVDKGTVMTKEENFERFFNKILHRTVIKGDISSLKLLLDYIENEVLTENKYKYFMTKNEENRSFLNQILSLEQRDLTLYSSYSTSNHSHFQYVSLLLERYTQILTPDDQYQLFMPKDDIYCSVLHSVALNKELSIVKLIFHAAENILREDFSKAFKMRIPGIGSILNLALLGRKVGVVKFILNEGKRILTSGMVRELMMSDEEENVTSLHWAALNFAPSINVNESKLIFKLGYSLSESVYLLLKEGEKLLTAEERRRFLTMQAANGMTALHLAADAGQLETTKLLLQGAGKFLSREDIRRFVMTTDKKNQTAIQKANIKKNYMIKTFITIFLEMVD